MLLVTLDWRTFFWDLFGTVGYDEDPQNFGQEGQTYKKKWKGSLDTPKLISSPLNTLNNSNWLTKSNWKLLEPLFLLQAFGWEQIWETFVAGQAPGTQILLRPILNDTLEYDLLCPPKYRPSAQEKPSLLFARYLTCENENMCTVNQIKHHSTTNKCAVSVFLCTRKVLMHGILSACVNV